MNYHYLNQYRQPVGPLTEEQLKDAVRREGLLPDTPVIEEQGSEWVRLDSLPTMAEELAAIENSSLGACPYCGKDITGFQMPAVCPHCGEAIALPMEDRESLWRHFIFSMKKTFTLRGRATRMEYWSFVLFQNVILSLIYSFIGIFIPVIMVKYHPTEENWEEYLSVISVMLFLYLLPALLLLIPYISVSIRRLHDIGASGVWIPGGILSFLTPLFAFFLLEPDTTAFAVAYALLCLVPIGIWCRIVISHFQDTQRGGNAYGPSSKYPR